MYDNKTSFEKHLIENAYNSMLELKDFPEMIANQLIDNLMIRGNLVWELLEATGDTEYTKETFVKAAKLVLDPDFLLH